MLGRFVRWVGSIPGKEAELVRMPVYLGSKCEVKLDELDYIELLTTLTAHNLASQKQVCELELRQARLPAATVDQIIRLTCLQPRKAESVAKSRKRIRSGGLTLIPSPAQEEAIV